MTTGVLETLNNPSLVASLGVSVVALLPTLEQRAVSTLSWSTLKWCNALIYALNVYATSRPGRFDNQPKQQSQEKNSEIESSSPTKSDQEARRCSLVAPAGWAFAIWAPIFTGEWLASLAMLFLSQSNPLIPLLRHVTPNLIAAQLCQILWTASSRPRYGGTPDIFIAPALLTATAYALNSAHQAFALNPLNEKSVASFRATSWPEYMILFFPLSLHFGWISAAALVNWNSSLAVATKDWKDNSRLLRWVGYASAAIATGVGIAVSVQRQAPVYGAVIAWALTACADTMRQRRHDLPTTNGPRMQMWLCRVGACGAGLASVVATSLRWRTHATPAP